MTTERWFVGLCIALAIVFVLFASLTVMHFISFSEEVSERGLKSIVEDVWCGENGCQETE